MGITQDVHQRVSENSTRDGVKGQGVGSLRKDGSEKFTNVDTIIQIR